MTEEICVYLDSSFLGYATVEDNVDQGKASAIARELLPKEVQLEKESFTPHRFIRFTSKKA